MADCLGHFVLQAPVKVFQGFQHGRRVGDFNVNLTPLWVVNHNNNWQYILGNTGILPLPKRRGKAAELWFNP